MGFLDLPAPFFDLVDRSLLGPLPPLARLILWAIVAAIVSLSLYRWLSPQRRIAETKAQAAEARRSLNAHDGDLESALPLMRRSMGLALRQVWLVLPGALVASLPVLALLVWLDGAYGYQFPAGQAPAIAVEPVAYSGHWQPCRLSAGQRPGRRRFDRASGAPLSAGRPRLAAVLVDDRAVGADHRIHPFHAAGADRLTCRTRPISRLRMRRSGRRRASRSRPGWIASAAWSSGTPAGGSSWAR
jgi:hypothetical protein